MKTDFKLWERVTLEQFARQVADEHLVLTEQLAAQSQTGKVDPKCTPAMCRALTDAEIVEVLHSHGIDTYKSKYGFPSLQVSATSVRSIRLVIESCVARLNIRAIAEQTPVVWRSVSTMPPMNESVMLFGSNSDNGIWIGYFDGFWRYDNDIFDTPMYWAPLPAVPQLPAVDWSAA